MVRRRKRRFKKDPLDYISLPRLNIDPDTKKGIFIVLILALGAISLLSLFDLAGNMGVFLAKAMTFTFGLGKWLFPIILLALGFFLYNEDRYEIKGTNYLGLFVFIISFHGLFHLFIEQEQWKQAISTGEGGGYVGWLVSLGFINIMGFWASLIVLICLILISLMLMFNTSLRVLIGSESWLAKLCYPFSFAYAKIFKRDKEEEDDNEEDEEEDEEEDDDENDEDDENNEDEEEDDDE